jgi:lipopolysaccharide export system permease protein
VKLSAYISKAILAGIMIVLIVFVGLLLFITLLSEISATGQGTYGFSQAIIYVLAQLPLMLYQIFPTIALIGVLLGLGSLASSNELTIMRTSGLSLVKISVIILITTFGITAAASLIGEGVAPQWASYANLVKAKATSNGQAISTLRGVWVRNNDDFYHIVAVDSSTHLTGVTLFQFDDNDKLKSASYAQSADYENDHWMFHNVETSIMQPNSVQTSTIATTNWPLHFNIHQFSDFDPTLLSLKKLMKQITYGKMSGSNIGNLQITFWTRVFQPITTLIMVLIAIPFIFGPLRSVSIGLRLLSGIMIGLVFFMVNRFLVSFSLVYQIPPLVSALILPIVGLVLAVYLFKWKS